MFDGKVSLLTGGGSGIGQAACHLYACEGARVVVSDIDDKAEAVIWLSSEKASFVTGAYYEIGGGYLAR